MKTTMSKETIIHKIVNIDVELNRNLYEHHLTPEKAAALRQQRERLERKLYK